MRVPGEECATDQDACEVGSRSATRASWYYHPYTIISLYIYIYIYIYIIIYICHQILASKCSSTSQTFPNSIRVSGKMTLSGLTNVCFLKSTNGPAQFKDNPGVVASMACCRAGEDWRSPKIDIRTFVQFPVMYIYIYIDYVYVYIYIYTVYVSTYIYIMHHSMLLLEIMHIESYIYTCTCTVNSLKANQSTPMG